jgi:hypothetical protein
VNKEKIEMYAVEITTKKHLSCCFFNNNPAWCMYASICLVVTDFFIEMLLMFGLQAIEEVWTLQLFDK